MTKDVKDLLKFISEKGPATKERLDDSGISYSGRNDNSSAKWESDVKIQRLIELGYIQENGGRAYPNYRATSEGEKYLQDEENTSKNIKWLIITNLFSVFVGGLVGGLVGHFLK